jgi:hypothetical protein
MLFIAYLVPIHHYISARLYTFSMSIELQQSIISTAAYNIESVLLLLYPLSVDNRREQSYIAEQQQRKSSIGLYLPFSRRRSL